jgi:hypothetical protein
MPPQLVARAKSETFPPSIRGAQPAVFRQRPISKVLLETTGTKYRGESQNGEPKYDEIINKRRFHKGF